MPGRKLNRLSSPHASLVQYGIITRKTRIERVMIWSWVRADRVDDAFIFGNGNENCIISGSHLKSLSRIE